MIFVFGLVLIASGSYVDNSFSQSSMVFAQASSSQNQTTTESFLTYFNPKYPFTLQYPQNWMVEEEQNKVWFTSPVDESGNFRIGIRPWQQPFAPRSGCNSHEGT